VVKETEKMPTEEKMSTCDFCGKGRIVKRKQNISFRQMSDWGHILCQAAVDVSVCDHCGTRSVEPGADKVFDDAFRRQYAALRNIFPLANVSNEWGPAF
jgi:hypothetical protein